MATERGILHEGVWPEGTKKYTWKPDQVENNMGKKPSTLITKSVPTYILEDGHRAELRQDVYYFIQTIE
jgi:hypothetical protein